MTRTATTADIDPAKTVASTRLAKIFIKKGLSASKGLWALE
jgi:hypothetical protein